MFTSQWFEGGPKRFPFLQPVLLGMSRQFYDWSDYFNFAVVAIRD